MPSSYRFDDFFCSARLLAQGVLLTVDRFENDVVEVVEEKDVSIVVVLATMVVLVFYELVLEFSWGLDDNGRWK